MSVIVSDYQLPTGDERCSYGKLIIKHDDFFTCADLTVCQ